MWTTPPFRKGLPGSPILPKSPQAFNSDSPCPTYFPSQISFSEKETWAFEFYLWKCSTAKCLIFRVLKNLWFLSTRKSSISDYTKSKISLHPKVFLENHFLWYISISMGLENLKVLVHHPCLRQAGPPSQKGSSKGDKVAEGSVGKSPISFLPAVIYLIDMGWRVNV